MQTAVSSHASRTHLFLVLIILVYAALATLYAVGVPKWNAPDEPAHFNNARHIAERFELPILLPGDYNYEYLEQLKAARFPDRMPVDDLRYEGHQPPLYYLLAAVAIKITAPLGVPAQLVAVRLLSVLLGLLALAFAYLAIRRIFPRDELLALGATATIAFIPMHLAVNAAASNDPLADLVMALLLYESAGIMRPPAGATSSIVDRANLRLGLWLGLALLSKVTVYLGAAVALVAIVVATRRCGARAALARSFLVGLVALGVSGWWFARDAAVYGLDDPLGLRRHSLVVTGQPLTTGLDLAVMVDFAATTFRSFWGQFGWMGVLLDARVYAVLAVYSLAALLGLALLGISRRDRPTRPLLSHPALLLGITAALVIAAMLYYSFSSFYQPQGRYLFPALPAIAVALIAGLRRLVSARLAPAVVITFALGLIVLDVAALYLSIIPALQP